MHSIFREIVLITILVLLEILHYFERNKLINKIMSKDYNDYKQVNGKKSKSKDLYKDEYEKFEEEWNNPNEVM